MLTGGTPVTPHDRQAIQCQFRQAVARHISRQSVKPAVATGEVDDAGSGGLPHVGQESLGDIQWPESVCLECPDKLVA